MKLSTGVRSIYSTLIFIGSVIGLQACGGGGGSAPNTAPTVSGVSITDNNGGSVEFGDTLTATYTYADAENNPEGATTFSWFRNGAAISGATASTYTVTTFDAVDSITVEITPVATSGTLTGSSVATSAITVVDFSNKLNDTGITVCGDYAYSDTGTSYDVTGSTIHNSDLDCSIQPTVPTKTTDGFDSDGDIIRAGQDVFYGRDVTNNDDSDGKAGFSFTKLDANGVALTNQTVAWNAAGSEATFDQWSCVKDNVTGLIWEVKTASGLHKNSYTYTWYNSTGINDGGDAGIGDTGVGTTTGFESNASIYAGSDACLDTARCDIEKFVEDVNATNLCGASDWRLPNIHELISIINFEARLPAVDTNYFPDLTSRNYWASSPNSDSTLDAWGISFADGDTEPDNYTKDRSNNARLVRGN